MSGDAPTRQNNATMYPSLFFWIDYNCKQATTSGAFNLPFPIMSIDTNSIPFHVGSSSSISFCVAWDVCTCARAAKATETKK
jgi:hypothetical protein